MYNQIWNFMELKTCVLDDFLQLGIHKIPPTLLYIRYSSSSFLIFLNNEVKSILKINVIFASNKLKL